MHTTLTTAWRRDASAVPTGRQRVERPSMLSAVVIAAEGVPAREGGERKCRSAAAIGWTDRQPRSARACGRSLTVAACGHGRRRRHACAPSTCRGGGLATCGHSTPPTSSGGTCTLEVPVASEVSIRARDGACGRLEAAHGHVGECASCTSAVSNRMSKISSSESIVGASEHHLDEGQLTAGLRVQKQGCTCEGLGRGALSDFCAIQ